MTEPFDIEALKVHKITPRKDDRKRLPLLVGQAKVDFPDVDQATAGAARTEHKSTEDIEIDVVAALKTVFDPEIPLNVYDLGLIYDLAIDEDANVEVSMTLTAPACPVAGQIVTDVATRVGAVASVAKAHVKLVWDPPWTKDRMSEEAMLELGLL